MFLGKNSMKYGIAITTHNRPDCLRLTMEQMQRCHSEGMKYVVVDDNSRKDAWPLLEKLSIPVEYVATQNRIGVARAKNLCLKSLGECEHYFLFDDDCFPIAKGWADWVVDVAKKTGQESFIYNLPGAMKVMRVQAHYSGVNAFQTGTGVFIYLSRKALDTVGGMNPNYGVWGHEHNGYCYRIHNAGLTKYPFQSPIGMNEFLYSLDMQGLNHIARKYMVSFQSSEPHELRNIWAKQTSGRDALAYDMKTNYYQPL
jgi:GT2 family glycosyltransferase